MTLSDIISIGGLVVSVASAAIAAGSLYYTQQQWQKIKNKVGMIDDWNKASEIMPAWYTTRMMSDHWLFGLHTTDGRTLVISRLNGISDDGEWLDVELETKADADLEESSIHHYVYAYSADRTSASVKVSSIVAAQELRTS